MIQGSGVQISRCPAAVMGTKARYKPLSRNILKEHLTADRRVNSSS